jgi:ubiquinone/menaquinone biosynthesis C-methylase UbiE
MDYWESKFRNGGALWHFEPSDSAMIALETFRKNGLNNILIPGIGYGRNARLFLDSGFSVTGIEISKSAINVARTNGLDCTIYHGSVTDMPFDDEVYDAVFCYALIHLLNKPERQQFLKSCFTQLIKNGLMIFVITSKKMDLFGKGKYLSKDRFEIEPGLRAFFYDSDSIEREFTPFGLTYYKEIEEPVKFTKGVDPLRLYLVVCKK